MGYKSRYSDARAKIGALQRFQAHSPHVIAVQPPRSARNTFETIIGQLQWIFPLFLLQIGH